MINQQLVAPLTPELYCANINKSLIFYIEVLGFCILYQRKDDGFAMLERQSAHIMLEEIYHNMDGTTRIWLQAPLEKPFGRGINLQIMTDKIDELYDHVQRSGANIFLPIEDRWYCANEIEIGQRQFIVLDPDGYMLRFSQAIDKRKNFIV